MLTIIEATELLNLTPICYDIQNKILMLFIGINGTPTTNLIKDQITSLDNDLYNGSLIKRIISENDAFTLWRLKVFLNEGKVFNKLYIKSLRVIYELKIAYLINNRCDWKTFASIASLLGSIKTNSDSDLFAMFYNLDKNNYKYLGTQTANIIHYAIKNKIIDEVDPMIWYDVDPDDKYY
jgi:hypothetical protein